MPFYFNWRMEDSRDVYWHIYDKKRVFLNPPEATKELYDPLRIPDPCYWPLKIQQLSKHKTIPDFCSLPSSHTLVVNRRARELFECFDPGCHTYVPLEMTTFADEVLVDQYWLLRVGNVIDGGLIDAKSDVVWVKSPVAPYENMYYTTTKTWPKLVWRIEKIAGCHLWIDRMLTEGLCISDELARELKRLKMKHYRLVDGGAE